MVRKRGPISSFLGSIHRNHDRDIIADVIMTVWAENDNSNTCGSIAQGNQPKKFMP